MKPNNALWSVIDSDEAYSTLINPKWPEWREIELNELTLTHRPNEA